MRRRAAVAAVGALLLLAGCDGGGAGGRAAPTTSTAPAPPAQLALSPATDAADVSPTAPVQVTVTGGEVTTVAVVDKDGTTLTGQLADPPQDGAAGESAGSSSSASATASSSSPAAGATASSGAPAPRGDDDPKEGGARKTLVWTPAEPLRYGTTYTVTATAQNRDKKEVTATTTFTTVKPKRLETPDVGPRDGTVVGVGLPIRVYFDRAVVNKADVERNLKVTSSTPTDGVWSWVNNREVHFRPSTYWPADIDVRLDAQLYGVDFGNGTWGEKNRTISFRIGARHVSIVDAAAHKMDVYDGDQLVQSWPISAGSARFPSHNGPHVVTELHRKKVMDSSTWGLPVDAPGGYRTEVDYAVRISNNGEFVHSAPWSVGDQGRRNVSHGCVNLAPSRAAWFFNFSQPGDVVEIKNSVGPALSEADGDIFDWTIPWEKWKAGSALT